MASGVEPRVARSSAPIRFPYTARAGPWWTHGRLKLPVVVLCVVERRNSSFHSGRYALARRTKSNTRTGCSQARGVSRIVTAGCKSYMLHGTNCLTRGHCASATSRRAERRPQGGDTLHQGVVLI